MIDIKGYKEKHEYISENGIYSIVYLMDNMDFMPQVPEKYFDLGLVDPPYGIGVNKMTLGNGKRTIYRGQSDWDNKTPNSEYWENLFKISKHQIVWGGNYMTQYLKQTSAWLFWDKGTGDNDFADGELAWTSYNGALRKINKSWVGANAKDGLERIHPTQKPIYLYDWIYKKYATEGMKILDTHLGSGSNRISAHKNKMNFIGVEIDKEYFDKSNKRFDEFVSQLTLF